MDNLNWYVNHGYVKTRPNMASAVDDSYCQAAVKRLGPYKAGSSRLLIRG
jgi:hypothetical protein